VGSGIIPVVPARDEHQGLLVYRPIDTDPVFPAAFTDDDDLKAAAEPDAEAPAHSFEARPDMDAPVLENCPVKTCE
jgi:hypothetical protein